jgi:signal transduction histidine kinase/HAMP domain-containing protein
LRSSVLFACALVAAVLAGLYLAHRMVVPIRDLGAGAELIGQGKLGHRIAIKTGDELEALAHQFNVMADRLQTSRSELTESHAKLEHRVEERTRDLARSLEELRALDEVSQAVNSTLDLQSVITTIVAKAVELSGAEAGAIYVFDVARAVFTLSATHGTYDETSAGANQQAIGIDGTLLGQAATRREPLHIEDVTHEEPTSVPEIFTRAGYKALLVIPLLWSDRIVGALVVQRRSAGRFGASTVTLLRTFAAHSVLAIQNARLFSELQEQGRQLTDANEQKSRFLAAASHDLRQPLHALELWAGLLRNALTNPVALERWDKMYLSIVSLDTLFSGLLDLSRFDTGSIVPDVGDVSVQNLFSGIENDYRGEALAKGLELRVAATDVWIRTDPLWIERILRNLTANAIKYTERGVVSLSCEQRGGAVHIVVKDTGIGIGASDQARIFEEYYQVDNPGHSRERGVGLGLAIVKRACELLDHPIHLHSEPGVGSEFTVVVPTSSSGALSNADELRVEHEGASLDQFVVVVIDDDPNIADAMKALLEECGCLAVVGQDLDAVMGLLSSSNLEPQAILADYRLGNGLTGIEAIAQLRATYGDVPAALVTGEMNTVALQELDRAPYQVLRKPLDPPRIRAVLRSFRQVVATSKGYVDEDLAGR